MGRKVTTMSNENFSVDEILGELGEKKVQDEMGLDAILNETLKKSDNENADSSRFVPAHTVKPEEQSNLSENSLALQYVDEILGNKPKKSTPPESSQPKPVNPLSAPIKKALKKTSLPENESTMKSRLSQPIEDGVIEEEVIARQNIPEPTQPKPRVDSFSPNQKPISSRRTRRIRPTETEPEVQDNKQSLTVEVPIETVKIDNKKPESDNATDIPKSHIEIAKDLIHLDNTLKKRSYLLFVIAIISLLYNMIGIFFTNAPSIFNPSTGAFFYCVINTAILSVAGSLCYNVIIDGIGALFTFRPERDTLVAISTVACFLQGLILLFTSDTMFNQEGKQIFYLYAPIAIIGLLFNIIAKRKIVDRMKKNFAFIDNSEKIYGVGVQSGSLSLEYTKGLVPDIPVIMYTKKVRNIKDFLYNSYGEDISDTTSRWLSIVVFILSLILGIAIGKMSAIGGFVSVFALTTCLCSPISYLFAVNLPLANSSSKLAAVGGALFGYNAIDDFADVNSAITDGNKLFQKGFVQMYGMKTFSDNRIDDSIVYAASVTNEVGSVLAPIFMDIIADRTDLLFPIENITYVEDSGVVAWVNNKRVLLGNSNLLERYGVHGPSQDYENRYIDKGHDVVYLSVNGELAAAFVVGLDASKEIRETLVKLKKLNISLVVNSVDSILTVKKISDIFKMNPAMFKILPVKLKQDYFNLTAQTDEMDTCLVGDGSFVSTGLALFETKKLKLSILLNIVIQIASIITGLLIVLAFGAGYDFSQISILTLILIQAIWLGLTFGIDKFRK